MLTITEKYKVFCAGLAQQGFGTFKELLNTNLQQVEEWRSLSILQNIISGK
ncbi:MAG: hypothetical protein WCK32_00735 [Chlorobiaceae bacterium]